MRVRYFSIYLNSSRLSCWGDTFLTMDTEKMSREKEVRCASHTWMEGAYLSHFSAVKAPRWPLVRLWHSWIVRPKYASFSWHSLQIRMYITCFDLQLRWWGIRTIWSLIMIFYLSFVRGHWRHPRAFHLWLTAAVSFKILNCLFRTNWLPIELCFFVAIITWVLPISCWNSLLRPWINFLSSDSPSK